MKSKDAPENERDGDQFPVASPTDGPMVPDLETMLSESRVRSVEDVLDYASTCALAVANGNVPAKLSKELRLWGELMYSCVQTQNITNGDGDVNFIGQLIQIAGNPEAPTLKHAAKAIEAKAEPIEESVVEIIESVAVNE